VAAAALTIVGYPLIQLLFGPKFSGAFVPMIFLMPGVVALSIANVLASDLAGRGRPEYASYAAGLTLVLTIGLDVLLIPRFGASGAALASTAAYSAAAGFLLVIFARRFRVSISELVIARRRDLVTLPWPRRARASPKP
jgi:O-antigen/teichoic acid export membrane protein